MLQSSYKGNEESWQFGFYSMVGIGNILVNNGGWFAILGYVDT